MLRIGGSVIASPVDPDLINKYVSLLKQLGMRGHQVAVVVGGGTLARDFIRIARELELDEQAQDEIAISVSRIFAQLLLRKLEQLGCETVPLRIKDAADCIRREKIAVMGGLRPGMTTDTVAALIVKQIKADLLVKATDQEGIHDKDPKKYNDAVKLDRISFRDLQRIFAESKHKAGIHQILDPEAVRILKKLEVRVIVVNGFKPENILAAVEGKKVGTLIE